MSRGGRRWRWRGAAAPAKEFMRIFREVLQQLEPVAAESKVRWQELV